VAYNDEYKGHKDSIKAWANIDGSLAAASMVQGSYNISSITDHGTGEYSFNFSTAMSDTHYSVCGGVGHEGGAGSIASPVIQSATVSLVKIKCLYFTTNSFAYDYNTVCVQIFGS
jgi:hypothetical protein